MPYRRFASKKYEPKRQDRYFDRESPNPLEKPEPAKKKATKIKLRKPSSR